MNVVFKLKVLGFFTAIILSSAVHLVASLIPSKKDGMDYPDYPEISMSPKDISL